jgi:hypothetical protein
VNPSTRRKAISYIKKVPIGEICDSFVCFFFLDLEQSILGSDLVLNHPNGVSTLYFQVATFQKRAALVESPPIPTAEQVPDRRPPHHRTRDPKLPIFRVISFATPHYVIYRLIIFQADAQEVLYNVYSSKMAPQARVIRKQHTLKRY